MLLITTSCEALSGLCCCYPASPSGAPASNQDQKLLHIIAYQGHAGAGRPAAAPLFCYMQVSLSAGHSQPSLGSLLTAAAEE